jgi:hypothetical protein
MAGAAALNHFLTPPGANLRRKSELRCRAEATDEAETDNLDNTGG